MNWQKNISAWFTLPLLAGIVVGALFLIGNIKAYLDPISSMSTIYRPKPVPVKVETVKWLKGDIRVKKEIVNVPVEVIREVPAKTNKRLEDDFHINVKDLMAEHKALVDVVDVPKAPHGGAMALTIDTDSGKIENTFRPNAAPVIEFGGIREAGAEYNVLQKGVTGYYRQDLVRIGPVVVGGRVFVTAPLAPGTPASYGASVGASVRF
jgi:hypothetical protein